MYVASFFSLLAGQVLLGAMTAKKANVDKDLIIWGHPLICVGDVGVGFGMFPFCSSSERLTYENPKSAEEVRKSSPKEMLAYELFRCTVGNK